MKDLSNLRKEIDSIDKNIVELFEKRMKKIAEISEYKKKNNIPILDKKREKDLINKNIEYLINEDITKYTEELFKCILKLSKDMQSTVFSRFNESDKSISRN